MRVAYEHRNERHNVVILMSEVSLPAYAVWMMVHTYNWQKGSMNHLVSDRGEANVSLETFALTVEEQRLKNLWYGRAGLSMEVV